MSFAAAFRFPHPNSPGQDSGKAGPPTISGRGAAAFAAAVNSAATRFPEQGPYRFLLAEAAFSFAATGVPNHFAKNGASALSGHQSASV